MPGRGGEYQKVMIGWASSPARSIRSLALAPNPEQLGGNLGGNLFVYGKAALAHARTAVIGRTTCSSAAVTIGRPRAVA